MLEQYCTSVSTRASSYGVTIPWEMILELVLQLIDECGNNEARFLQTAKNPNVFNRVVLKIRVKQILDLKSSKQATTVVDSIFDCCKGLSEEDLSAGFNEGVSVLRAN